MHIYLFLYTLEERVLQNKAAHVTVFLLVYNI